MDDTLHRAILQEHVSALLASKRTPLITDDKYDKIVDHLKKPNEHVDPHLKHWIKTRGFRLAKDSTTTGHLPDLKISDCLVIPAKNAKPANFLHVIPTSMLYDVLKTVHEEECEHKGYRSCAQFIYKKYFGITRSCIQIFCKFCPSCQLKQTAPPAQQVTVCENFLDRVEVDIIDMRHSPDGDYHYIGHFVDYFSEYHILFPLKSKSATELAEMIEERVLAYLGPPCTFHNDNDSDFTNEIIHSLFEVWNGDVTFVRGHLHSDGLIESGNSIIDDLITAMKLKSKAEDGEYTWAKWLPRIMYHINTITRETTGQTPYKLVIGQDPKTRLFHTSPPYVFFEELEADRTASPAPSSTSPPPDSPTSFSPSTSSVSSQPCGSSEKQSSSPSPRTRKRHHHTDVREKADDCTIKSARKIARARNCR